MILQHHERLDGSGYPAGLRQEQISIGGRVIAVADVVEAMRSHRPYRLRLETQRRLLGNGYCTRPAELDCAFETVCETCIHFDTGPEFVPVLMRQRDHAAERHHTHLVTVYDRLLERIEPDDEPSPTYAGEDQT